jgi:integrase
MAARRGKPVSPRTVEFARAVLRRAMNDAVMDRLIEVNPVIGSKTPKKDGKPKHTTWTGEQAQTFLQATARTRLAPLWQLALATGMRRGS